MKWAPYVCVDVVNIVNPAVVWPPLLHTLTDRDYILVRMTTGSAYTCHMTLTSV